MARPIDGDLRVRAPAMIGYADCMERPQNILGLAAHVVRLRWQALTSPQRMIAVATATFLGLAVASAGVHMATGSCCASHCASHAAEHGCPHSH